MIQSLIAVMDLGSTENARVAREIRAKGVYSEVIAHDTKAETVAAMPGLCGIILNGGENRVVNGAKIDVDPAIFELGHPVLAVDHNAAGRKADLAKWPEDMADTLDKFIEKCGCERNWSAENFVSDAIEELRKQIGSNKVLLALSGGVDSSVVAALLIKAIGTQLTCVHVNHGLLRKGEPEQVIRTFRDEMGANLIYVDATDRFLGLLEDVADPEEKRKIIGAEFINVFQEEADKLDGINFLAQGTIYPDILESGTKTAPVIKSHHNVGGLPVHMDFELVEPLKYLFKDEVRAVGRALGLPDVMVNRQPFPGPGLGVRCTGAITRKRLAVVREADAILREEFHNCGLEGKVWQYFTVVPPVRSTGVRDNKRSFEYPVIIRAVNTVDAMTATVEQVPWDVLLKITDRILNEVKNCNRVLYDLSPKPVATIEWE